MNQMRIVISRIPACSMVALMFMLIGIVFLRISLSSFFDKIGENIFIDYGFFCTNFFSILNCFLLLPKTISFICVLMYPTFLSYYYKHFECDVKPEVEEWNENCIETISN